MKRLLVASTALLVLFASLDAAEARRHRRHRARAVHYTTSRTFGLGVIIAGPTGLSGKLYMSSDFALDFAVGWYYGLGHDHGAGAHFDLLWHPVDLAAGESFDLPLYLGVGAMVVDDRDHPRDGDEDVEAGLRIPLGIAFEFGTVPLDIFFELAIIVALIDDDDHRLAVDGAVGVRYWF